MKPLIVGKQIGPPTSHVNGLHNFCLDIRTDGTYKVYIHGVVKRHVTCCEDTLSDIIGTEEEEEEEWVLPSFKL